jgi:DASS family divalent anion:Na+ symporter
MSEAQQARPVARRAGVVLLAVGLWLVPVPAGLTAEAWHLFAIFAAAIVSVVVSAFPLLVASLLAAAAVVLSGTLAADRAFSSFANPTVLLVVSAFLVSQAVIKSGLGRRISLRMVSRFGRSPLGLAYSIVLTDTVIAPAFPSNTARGGVLYPVVRSLADDLGSRPGSDPQARRLGGYLMFTAMASLGLSSVLWLTATSTNVVSVQIAEAAGVPMGGFTSWLAASCVPSLVGLLILPLVLLKLCPPGVTSTPEAPAAARAALDEMGALSRAELLTTVVFGAMVLCWGTTSVFGLSQTAVAFGAWACCWPCGC